MVIRFDKYVDGLVPAVVQDDRTGKVLMLGFMNGEALDKTKQSGKVTFFSRTKKRLWTKGEESGNFLILREILVDCDQDSLLIKAEPTGPVCHTGADTCWNEKNQDADFLSYLEQIIDLRKNTTEVSSYVSSLFGQGTNKIAQKVGEEAVELVIEATGANDKLFKEEAADLLFHFLILLNAKGHNLKDIIDVLRKRHLKIAGK
ncbi:MAG TPA: bifunctional phosphoribosyl-AMP cyclohydrolase/phosphoribosyl-ATP diphosphatase HisIE [Puia sp.]|nr:bifunctional phosphoribosyl-AMP cyclohydrolase/phosphoribosyl-ATP diphosphatase HisIE [Puia sp.]